MRREAARRFGQEIRKLRELLQQGQLAGMGQWPKISSHQGFHVNTTLTDHAVNPRMRILHVVHRVFIGGLLREVDVEHELGVGLARDEKKPHRVAAPGHVAIARHADQIMQRDIGACALRDFYFFTALHHRDHFVQQVVRIARWHAEVLLRAHTLQTGTHPRDGAVMVAALHVDDARITALPFGEVIRHVRHEVGVSAVGFFHYPVFVVPVIGGLQPERAVLLVGLAGGAECLHGGRDFTPGVERRLKRVVIETHAERAQVHVLLAAQIGDSESADRVDVVQVARRRHFTICRFDGFLCEEIFCDVGNVFAVVGRLGPLGITRLEATAARLHRQREIGDLHAGIVVIKLARHREALGLEQIA